MRGINSKKVTNGIKKLKKLKKFKQKWKLVVFYIVINKANLGLKQEI
tara:strand:+ start:1222 stop:1362 length:141 start_codon:yes stop_codon:yes gene_type:complete